MPLQANSLSSVTQLAGNPPRYPRNPTWEKKEPLVLYIARVPGSRDVMLTTMKPRLKNVTAEDVLNSLYYFHVDTPSDVFLMGDMKAVETLEPTLEQSTAAIVRKPLPENSAIGVSKEIPQLPEKGRKTETTLSRAPSGALKFQTVSRPPLPRRPLSKTLDLAPPLPQRLSMDIDNIPARRPLGPRPYLAQPEMVRKPLPRNENTLFKSDTQQQAAFPDPAISIPLIAEFASNKNAKEIEATGSSIYPSNLSDVSAKEALSITIIRRDPSSGAQWNVGKIRNQSRLENQALSNTASLSMRMPCSSILVQLSTLGYGQFCPSRVTRNIDSSTTNGADSQKPQDSQHTFDRHVQMAWSKPWGRKFKHGRASSDQTGDWKGALKNRSLDAPSGNFGIEGAEGGSKYLGRNLLPTSGFLSPWNGRCEFATSAGGRSLKCKHTLNNPSTSSSPALPSSGVAAEVSELRFNLPSSYKTHTSTDKALASRPASSHNWLYSRTYSDTSPRPPETSYAAMYPSDDDNENDSPDDVLDLSLGREKAGGGVRGKRAKLGKLIVHEEGLQMLDLVVAANMGIWWTVWER